MKKTQIILIVDDEADIHHILKISLSKSIDSSFVLESAMNGKQAVEKYKQLSEKNQQPFVVLMDLKMPVMDGIEAIQNIIKHHANANIYAFTAYGNTTIGQKAIDVGAKGIIDKSLSYDDVIAQILTIIKKLKK